MYKAPALPTRQRKQVFMMQSSTKKEKIVSIKCQKREQDAVGHIFKNEPYTNEIEHRPVFKRAVSNEGRVVHNKRL